MGTTKTFTKSFSGGELSPAMFGRIDDAKFMSGAAVLENFIATPQGPAQNRPGFQFVKETRNSNNLARLIPFTYNLTQTMVIELGNFYMRFHTQGQTLLYSATQRPFVGVETVTFTIASPTVVTWTGHQLINGDPVAFEASFGGSLPAGVVSNERYTAGVIDANTIHILDSNGTPVTVTGAGMGTFSASYYYAVGDIREYMSQYYYSTAASPDFVDSGAPVTNWYQMPSDLTYEIPSPYSGSDIFGVHYVQSADVMTLVHPLYPPMELRRLGASQWVLSTIIFGATVATPTGVAVSPSPGYLAQIATVSLANPALITTRASHTLSLGDGIYIDGLIAVIGGSPTDESGFYLVNLVPVDPSTGDLIPNELQVMDYSGNVLDSSGWSSYTLSPGTIQFGTKIFDINNHYAVVAVGANGTDQSLLSSSVSALNNLDVPGSYNSITWTAVPGASSYYIFKQKNGLWGFIGQAVGTTFTDNNIAPDFSITPQNPDNPFYGTGNYPAAVGYIEQRRVFAGTNNFPQNVWMTNSGTESTFSYSLPSQDTDRIEIKIAAREVSGIEHVVPLQQLILLTGSCEYAELTANDGPITPTSIGIRPQSYIGSSNVQPYVINNALVYCAARGGHVREMGYNWQSNGYITGDLSLRSAHLFDLLTIADQAFSKAPLPIVWFVSRNGNLLGLTYVPEQQIGAWHHHVTDGIFESITAVAEGAEERLYAVIRRQIDGNTVRYVERMGSLLPAAIQDSFFVDSGLTYSGAPATTISGLDWLEGQTVAVLADGAVQTQKTVVGGSITLDAAASVVQVGLPYIADIQLLPITLGIPGFGQGIQLNINKTTLRVYQSSGIKVGPSADLLTEAKVRTDEPYGAPPSLKTGNIEVVTQPSWNYDGQLLIRQENPLPLTVTSVTLEVSIGG